MDTQKTIQDGISMIEKYRDIVVEYLIKYGFQVLGGLVIILAGFIGANWVQRILLDLMHKKRHMDISLAKFIANTVKFVILTFVFLMAAEKFGINSAPVIATVTAAIFGASFAIQAPLSNYAAGLSVIFTHPFVVGNTITVKGVSGVVEEVKLPCTVLVNGEGERITIPNKDVVGEVLYNSFENKLVERVIGIGYSEDANRALRIVSDTLKSQPGIIQNPPPAAGIDSFGDSAVNIGMRYWVPTKEYFPTLYAANLAVYEALKKAGVTIPFPQREVRVLSGEPAVLKASNGGHSMP